MHAATKWRLKSRYLDLARPPLVMGILNVTPDSFSDGGRFQGVDQAVRRAMELEKAGADIIDIGGESTRPYSTPVAEVEELERVVPVIEKLAKLISIPISIDTSKAVVAEAALSAGAEIINDVTGLEGDPRMPQVAFETGAGLCLMHMQGTPQTMQDNPTYCDVVEEIYLYLQQRLDACLRLGIDRERICLDPGVGFGKTHHHNITLLQHANRFLELGQPILIGHSRKGFIAHILRDKHVNRMAGTLGVSLSLASSGVQIIRVHDVLETVHALKLYQISRGNWDLQD